MTKKYLFLLSASFLVFQSCSSEPSASLVEKQLDADGAGLWNFKDVEIVDSRSEKEGESKAAYVKFKAIAVNSEPTYELEASSVRSSFLFRPKRESELEYVKVLHEKDTEVNMSGNMLMVRDPKTKDWASTISYSTPLRKQGVPKSKLSPRQVLKGSPEEKQLLEQRAETQKLDQEATLKRLFSQESNGYMRGDFTGGIKLRFDEVDYDAKTVEGQITVARGVIKSFTGTFTDRDLVFTTDQVIQGQDEVGVGTKYTLLIEALQPSTRQIEGTYGHSDRRSGELTVRL